ncbi:MAG: hypothetical protein WA055_04450 [Candidatus Moraniibacteriota bacterium]
MKKTAIFYLVISFILNFIWEVSQVGLYEPHFNGVLNLVSVHLKATMGDVIIFLIIYALMGLLLRNVHWIVKDKVMLLVLAAILGFIFSVIVEKYALTTGRWKYNEIMPIIPYIKVGLVPVLQLTILVPLATFVTRRYAVSQMK